MSTVLQKYVRILQTNECNTNYSDRYQIEQSHGVSLSLFFPPNLFHLRISN